MTRQPHTSLRLEEAAQRLVPGVVGSMLVEDDPRGRFDLMTSTDASLHSPEIVRAGASSACS